MDELKTAINKTRNYAKKYGQSLNDQQLFLRLISQKSYRLTEIMGKGNKKITQNDWQNKLKKAELFTQKYLEKMEGILMVGVTGSVAAEFAFKNEDIDLLIVTKNNELWWWRLYLRFFIWWHKIPHRKFGEKENADEFCFNLWLDENNLSIPKNKRNLKNATDLILMKPVWEKNNIYYKFLKNNKWVKKYLATGYEYRKNMKKSKSKKQNNNRIKKIINIILFGGQYLYMRVINKQKPKKNEINLSQAFFHKNG